MTGRVEILLKGGAIGVGRSRVGVARRHSQGWGAWLGVRPGNWQDRVSNRDWGGGQGWGWG